MTMSRSQLLGIEGSSYRAIETVEVLQPAFLIASCTIEVSSSSVTCSMSASYETRVPPRMVDRLFAIDYGSRSTAMEISRSQLTAAHALGPYEPRRLSVGFSVRHRPDNA